MIERLNGAGPGRGCGVAEQCIFCRIIAGEVPSTRIYESDTVVAFADVHAQAPAHILVVPRRHVAGLAELPGADPTWNALIAAVQHIAQERGLTGGFRVVANVGEDAGQSVPHLHLHVLGGRRLAWPPG